MSLIRDFNLEDAHAHDDARVGRALGPLLEGDDVGQVWVLSVDGDLVGYCVLTWGYSLEAGGRECVLDEIYVRPSSRGLGGVLLETSLDAARRAGVNVAFLETEAHNERVRAFYLRHEFSLEDSIWMRRVLVG